MHSFVSCLMHCVFATKERRPLIKPDLQQRLWPYLGGIARENKMKALVVGGMEDHVHVLLSIPSTLSMAKSIQLLKGNSSKWIHDTFKEHWDFEWQEVTARSALASLASRTRRNTFKAKPSTIGR